MKNIFKTLIFAAAMLFGTQAFALDVNTLNYDGENAIPSGYTLSTTNPPSIATDPYNISANGNVIAVTPGGGSINSNLPAKRYLSFNVDELPCTVEVICSCANTSRKLYIGTLTDTQPFSADVTRFVSNTISYTFTSTGTYCFYSNGSNMYIGKITFTTTGGGGNTPSQPTTYTITYNTNGHGTAPAPETGATALPATLPTLTETGWTFDDWYTDANFSTPAQPGAAISVNTTLYAKWIDNSTLPVGTYTITYNTNGHGTAPAPVTGVTDLTQAHLPTLSASGWLFLYWCTDAALQNVAMPGPISSNITLYAKWMANPTPTYTITYNTNGHGTAPAAVTNATALPATLPTLTASGWTFNGWYTDANFSTPAQPGAAISVNTTLYAKWTASTPSQPTNPTLPSTTLTLHEPEVYETSIKQGGYGTPLVNYNGHDYEVYYINRDNAGKAGINTSNIDKVSPIFVSINDNNFKAIDGWFSASVGGNGGDTNLKATEEFQTSVRSVKLQNEQHYLEMHIKGYTCFTLAGKDNNSTASKGKYFKVFIDGVLQPANPNDQYSLRRYPITADEHVIRVEGLGGSDNKMVAFSLQVAYVPKLKYIDGNDSTQVVNQTRAIKPITYFLKNHISDATLSWNGAAVPGITLQKGTNDTLYIQGNADAKVGSYEYVISAKDNENKVVSTISGKFSIITAVRAKNGLNASIYTNNPMTAMVYDYDALSKDSIVCAWTGATPAGITFKVDPTTQTITLSGTPTTVGSFPYTITCKSGNTLSGTITIKSDSPIIVPGATKTLLYLYKDNEESGILTFIATKYNYFARPAADELAAASVYAPYDAIVISEDVDATSGEVLAIIRELKKPVLNMKIYTYSSNRLGWGDPNNGSNSNKVAHVLYPNHPIFNGLAGDLTLLSGTPKDNRGLMVADITYQGTVCLATAPKRGDDYDSDGDDATFIHEVPADMRGAKYLSYPIGLEATKLLSPQAKTLFTNMITYLTSNTPSGVVLPELRITSFTINGTAATIDETNKTINITMPIGTDATSLAPIVSLASPQTTVTPNSGATVDFSDTHYGVIYTVSDGINQKKYTVKVLVPTDLSMLGNEGLWYAGDLLHNDQNLWVNIFNVNGQLVTTTNSDFSFADMPRGIYLVRTENAILKIMH